MGQLRHPGRSAAATRCRATLSGRTGLEALDVAIRPAPDAVVNQQVSELASRNGDEYLGLLMAEFQLDAQRSRD